MKNCKPARGTKGFIQSNGDGTHYFRVYENDTFTDYKLWHYDLEVEILDTEAFLYENGERNVLDHSPETLGLK